MKKIISAVLALLMIISIIPMSAIAEDTYSWTVASTKDSTLAKGVTQTEGVAYNAEGARVAFYTVTADISREDVGVYANYYNNQLVDLGMQTVIDQAHAAEKNHADVPNYKVVATTNADFYNMSNGKPIGVLVMEGVALEAMGTSRSFFGIKKDGTPIIGKAGTYSSVADQMQEAVGGGVVMLYDGEILSSKTDRNTYPRSIAGITADGKVVLMVTDGQQAPISVGMSYYDVALQMQSMGCTYAIELDGGGSATIATKAEGSDDLSLLNNPCDGAMRTVSSSLMIVSTAVSDGTFDHAALEAEETYVSPESSVKVSAIGADASGGAAEIPADISWQLKDASMGTVVDGVFTSNGTVGKAVVQMVYNGNVVGETTINVVIPEAISFLYPQIVVPYDKSVNLEVKATVNGGVNEVTLKDGDIKFQLSSANVGTIVGSKFTACSESSGVTTGEVFAKFKYDETITTSASFVFGRASSIAYDFEDGDISGLTFKSAYLSKQPKFGRWCLGDIGVADKTEGERVKNGSKALEVNIDFSKSGSMGWKAMGLSGLDIDLTDAVRVGFWLYIPKEARGFVEVDFNNDIVVDDFCSSVYASDFDGGWFYVSTTAISSLGSTLDSLYFYASTNDDNVKKYPNYVSKYTLIVDDITVDYSNAVSDRTVPEFTSTRVSYDGLADSVAINNQTITENEVFVSAQATDDTALDISSAKVYVDGNELPADMVSCTSIGLISTENFTLADGVHDFTFEIKDLEGNEKVVTRSLTVNAGSDLSTVKFVPQDPDADRILIGSVQWFDLVPTNIENVEKIVTTIDLDGMSNWELDNMEVAYGFEAEYTIDKYVNDATITITKTGDVELTGEQAIASIPIRTWIYTNHIDYPNDVYNDTGTGDADAANTPHTIWKTDAIRRVAMMVKVDAGKVEYTDGTSSTFVSKEHLIDTELFFHSKEKDSSTEIQAHVAGKYAFHEHKAEAIADKAATCTEAGYTGRTVCVGCKCNDVVSGQCDAVSGCGSVVDWGTVIPAKGHTYEVKDGVLKCKDCDKLYNGEFDGKNYVDGIVLDGWVGDKYYKDGAMLTGVKAVEDVYYNFGEDGVSQGVYTGNFTGEDGKHYYAKLGTLTSGWVMIDTDWYYFDTETYAGVSGEVVSDKYSFITYKFDETGKLTEGVWFHDGVGYRYYYGPDFYRNGFQTIDGKTYAFLDNVRLEGGIYRIKYSQAAEGWQLANFDDNGVYLGDVEGNGLVDCVNGLYYYENGKVKTGLVKVDGDYYYFNVIDHTAVKDCKYQISNRNGITELPYGEYEFDSEGKLIHKNGVYKSGENYYYYENSVRTNAGLVKVGDDYYYARANGLCAKDGTFTVTETSCDLPAGEKYKFGADGKMLNGLVDEGNYTFYYENGKRTAAGLVEIDGDYYYIDDKYLPKRNGIYTIKKSDIAEIPVDSKCKFDAEGKMYQGVYEEGTAGNIYYYENGKKTEAGIVEVDGEYYYARANGLCAKNGTYTVTKSSVEGVEIGAKCRVHEDARIYHGIENVNGNLYYYNIGQRVEAGLVKVGDDYYYTKTGGLVSKSGTYTAETTSCDLPAGEKYKFGDDGKMLQGVVEEGTAGNSYYYVNGQRVAAGLVKVGNDYYYAKENGLVAKNGTYTAETTSCDLPAGEKYKFGADGKMLQGIVDEGNYTFYYKNGQKTYGGLVKVDGDYYCVNKAGIVEKNTESVPTVSSCDLPAGVGIKYAFGADGKMLQGIVDGYYYKNGQKAYAGLVKVGDDYYYIGKDFKPVCNADQFAYYTSCDLAGGTTYTFGADGKLVK